MPMVVVITVTEIDVGRKSRNVRVKPGRCWSSEAAVVRQIIGDRTAARPYITVVIIERIRPISAIAEIVASLRRVKTDRSRRIMITLRPFLIRPVVGA